MKEHTKILTLATLLFTLFLQGCSDATQSRINASGNEHHVRQFSGGELIGEWCATGKIENESRSDGYYFNDRETGQLVSVSGDIQILVGCQHFKVKAN